VVGLQMVFHRKSRDLLFAMQSRPRSDTAFLHLMAFRNELGLTAPVSL
jgi:hypothetical protein